MRMVEIDDDESQKIVTLMKDHRRNQRYIYVALAVAVASLTSLLYELFTKSWNAAPQNSQAYTGVFIARLTSMWFVDRLAKENRLIREQLMELGKDFW